MYSAVTFLHCILEDAALLIYYTMQMRLIYFFFYEGWIRLAYFFLFFFYLLEYLTYSLSLLTLDFGLKNTNHTGSQGN